MRPSDRVTVHSSDLFTWDVTINGRDTYMLPNTTRPGSQWVQRGRDDDDWEVVTNDATCAILDGFVAMHRALNAIMDGG